MLGYRCRSGPLSMLVSDTVWDPERFLPSTGQLDSWMIVLQGDPTPPVVRRRAPDVPQELIHCFINIQQLQLPNRSQGTERRPGQQPGSRVDRTKHMAPRINCGPGSTRSCGPASVSACRTARTRTSVLPLAGRRLRNPVRGGDDRKQVLCEGEKPRSRRHFVEGRVSPAI